jgi:hypothetical protein
MAQTNIDDVGLIDDLDDFDSLIAKVVYSQQHEREFVDYFSNTFLSWQKVEAQLFLIFNTLFPSSNNRLVSASFHSIVSLDGRLSMISAVAELQLEKNAHLIKEWNELKQKTKKLSQKRNYLAHFSLHKQSTKDKDELRLKPSIFDSRPSQKDYGINELRQFRISFIKLEEALSKYNDKLRKLSLR